MPADSRTDATRGRLVAACLIVVCLCLTLCLGSGLLAAAWVEVPALHGSADYVYACAGVNLYGRFRIGVGWSYNLAAMVQVTIALPQNMCGYWPRPPFLSAYGYQIYQP